MCLKPATGMANNGDKAQTAPSLILVSTVCSDLSVALFGMFTVIFLYNYVTTRL